MVIFPAILEQFRTLKDKTLKVTFELNELSPSEFAELSKYLQRFGYIAFKENKFIESEKELLNNLQTDLNENGKTKSQRLRAVLYRNFEQESLGYEVFDDYYNHKMEKLINHFKDKLE